MQLKHDVPGIKRETLHPVVRRQYLLLLAIVPLLTTCIFSWAIFRYGSPGFRVDKTRYGLYISKVLNEKNPVQSGDLIVAINGLPYRKVLGLLLISPSWQSSALSVTVLRDQQISSFRPSFIPLTWSVYLAVAWPYLLLIFLFLILGTTALFRADPGQPAGLFFFMLCWFATTIGTSLPSHFGLLQPKIISLTFLDTTISNWLAFGALAHFICRFPKERDLCQTRPFMASIFYLAPPLITLGFALFTAGFTVDLFSALQQFCNLCVPLIITGGFIKHVIDLRYLRSPLVKNQVKLSIAAYCLTFAPYLSLYLLPNLLFDQPLISFRILVLAAIILPTVYFIALVDYRSLGITPLINRAQYLIDTYFFPYRLDGNRLLFDFSQKLASTLRLSELIMIITKEFPQQAQITKTSLLLLEGKYSWLYPKHLRIGSNLWSDSHLIQRFNKGEQTFFCHEKDADPQLNLELSQLREAGYVLVLPLRGSTQVTGVILFGSRKDGRLFQKHDIQILATFSNQAAIALKNSLHYTSLLKSKEQLEALFPKVVQSEKMAALGEMSATLAHEIKNPLGIIRSSAQYLADNKRSAEINQEMLHYIIDEVDELNTLISNILGLAKFKNPRFKPIDLQQDITTLCSQWQGSDDHNPKVRLHCTVARRLPLLYADSQQMRQVLLNLIHNSEDAMPDGGDITLTVKKEDEFALLCVQDDGPGIAQGHLDNLFKKFFTTKKDGLGLGLNVCEQIIAAHHGSITIHNRPKGGAEVLIRLPFQPLAILTQKNNGTGKTDECKDTDT